MALGLFVREIVAIEVDIAGDEEVEAAVAVVVAPGCPGRPIAEGDAGFFSDVGEGSIMIVVVEAVLAPVGNEQVGPAVVVIVGDSNSKAPSIVGDAGLGGYVGEGSVVIVVKECGVRGGFFAVEGVEGRAVDEVDIEPAVVVVVDEADAGAVGFDDEPLLGGAHDVFPAGEASGGGSVLEDDGAGVYYAAGGDGGLTSGRRVRCAA